MSLIEQLLAILRNTFLESIRQPVVLVVCVAAMILVVLSNPFSAWTMQDDQRMFVDIGLSTVFLATAVLAAFISTNVLAREIENRTVLTVVSKPVPRPIFILGKYLGVSAAMVVALLFLGLVFALVEVHGTLQTARDPFHLPAIVFGLGGLLGAVGSGAWMNYFYGRSFAAWTLGLSVPFLGLGYLLALLFDAEFNKLPVGQQFEPEIWKALLLMALATMVLNAIAIAASTRLGQVLTLTIVVGMFLLGLLSDWLFARPLANLAAEMSSLAASNGEVTGAMHAKYWTLTFLRAAVPNFQMFWLADAITQKRPIPLDYIATAVPYTLALVTGMLSVATMLFQRREVG